jgi:ubiquinone/menaquinone biosynthesis C-methylase UbiE
MIMPAYTWPKTFPPLTPKQERIRDDFMKYWHEVLPRRFGVIDRFNHNYPVRRRPEQFLRTLEIGAGIGEHLEYEQLTPEQARNYHAVELRENMSAEIRRRFPQVQTITADCQERLPFPDDYFDRVLAIHVLEHLPNLPAAVREMYRVCNKKTGVCSIVIPCEGSLAYTLARRISAQRIFEKRYGEPYRWFIEREHVNRPEEILDVLATWFEPTHRTFFPLRVPAFFCNLVIGVTLKPRLHSQCDMLKIWRASPERTPQSTASLPVPL